MFDKNYNSIFENEDEFGIDEYRQDFYHIFLLNSVRVKLIKPNYNNPKTSNDFFSDMKTNIEPFETIIRVSIQTDSPENKKLEEEGYTSRGIKKFTCVTPYDVEIDEKCYIEFMEDYGLVGIKSGQTFRVELEDAGMWKGQYGFRTFAITAR